MYSEIDKNKELVNKYSKYELVNIVFLLLKKAKKDREKMNKKVILTDLIKEILSGLSDNKITVEEVKNFLEEENIKIA